MRSNQVVHIQTIPSESLSHLGGKPLCGRISFQSVRIDAEVVPLLKPSTRVCKECLRKQGCKP